MIKYVITHINKSGMRQLTGPNQGHRFDDTSEKAQARLDTMIRCNSPEQLSSFFGPQSLGTFEVRPVECYKSGDAMGIYFDTDATPTPAQA